MPDHAIRLRAAWEMRTADASIDEPWLRVNLPTPAGNLRTPSSLLRRRFQKPRIDPEAEALWIVLEDVPGLVSVDLNGKDLGPTESGSSWPIDLGLLNLSNVLQIQVDSLAAAREGAEQSWGSIHLSIRPRPGQ